MEIRNVVMNCKLLKRVGVWLELFWNTFKRLPLSEIRDCGNLAFGGVPGRRHVMKKKKFGMWISRVSGPDVNGHPRKDF